MKKCLSIVVSLAMVFVLALPVFALVENQGTAADFPITPLETDHEILQLNQSSEIMSAARAADAVDRAANLAQTEQAFDSMMRSFYDAQEQTQEDTYTVNGIASDGFPASYAGAYVNEDMNLVVLLAESEISTTAALASSEAAIAQATGEESVVYASAKYSYRELVSVMDEIYQYTKLPEDQMDPRFSVVSYGLDDYNNCVTVGLEALNPESIAAFQEVVCDSAAITFEFAEPMEFYLTLNPGIRIDNQDSGTYGSLGYRCSTTLNGKTVYGFVSAAHCFDTGDAVGVVNSTVATATSKRQLGGKMDAVFCQVTSGNSVGTTIASGGGTLKNGVDANLAQGNPISKSGISTGITSGTVTKISVSIIESDTNTQVTDVIFSADLTAAHGDSGGIVYSTRTGSNYVAGIITGGNSSGSYGSKAININTGLGLSMYD